MGRKTVRQASSLQTAISQSLPCPGPFYPLGLSLSLLWETDTQYVMRGYTPQCLICFSGSSGVSREPIFRACVAQLPCQSNDRSM